MARNDPQKTQQSAARDGPRESQGAGGKQEASKSRESDSGGDMTRMKNRREDDHQQPCNSSEQGSSISATASSHLKPDLDASTSTPKDKERESRSERNKKKLKEICLMSLKERGIGRKDSIFNGCFTRLYTISKSFVKDLKTSQNLREEMRKIVESNADLVVNFEKNRV